MTPDELRRISPRRPDVADRTLANWEAHLRGCAQCAASSGPEELCYVGKAFHRKIHRGLTR